VSVSSSRPFLTAHVAVMAMAAVSAAGCVGESGAPAADGFVAVHELPPAPSDTVDASIFDLDFDLVDQAGETVKLADLGDRPTVAAMVYTSCDSVCIMVTEQMKAVERQLAGVDTGVRYVLFSLDPGRDTPEAMRNFATAHRLDTTRWRLMAAAEDDVRTLAAVLGVRYQPEPGGEIAHSAMVFVIDARGVVRHRQVGVGKDATELVAAVGRARSLTAR
jgi:protein SCO1/2